MELPLFIFGAFITGLVVLAIAALLWAAAEDGRLQERKAAAVREE